MSSNPLSPLRAAEWQDPGEPLRYAELQGKGRQTTIAARPGEPLIGVLYICGANPASATELDRNVLDAIAGHFQAAMALVSAGGATGRDMQTRPGPAAQPKGPALHVRRFRKDNSIFFDDDYVIKGLAGAVLWILLTQYVEDGRTEFSNRALRLEPLLKLPAMNDNLESRLVLLQRRLVEHDAGIAIERTGRGRFRLVVSRPLRLAGIG